MNHRRYTYLVGEDILLLKRRYTSFLKETHRSLMRSGMGALLLWLLLLTACVGEELQKPILGEGEGYLRLQVAPVSAEITTSPLTKAEIPTEQIPKPNECAIKITNKSTGKSTTYANSAALPDPLVLKAGVTYTVEAYHRENNTLQETPYFHKSTEVTIKANQNNDVKLIASLANAMLEPLVDANLAKHYSTWKLTASTSDKSYTFAEKDKPTTTLYAQAGKAVTFTFSGTNLAGKEVSSSWDKTFAAGYAYQLQCNPNIEAFNSIKVNATAEHTYDGGYLTGTNITSFSADPNEADLDAIASWQVDVKYGEQTIRTYTGASLDTMTCAANDWPYIPKDCSLSASVTLKAGDVISDLKGDFTSLPAPDFGITVTDAQTSYSVYKNAGAATANTKDGSSIFDITSSVSISQEILNKYPELLSNVTYSEDLNSATTSAKLGASASLSNLSWARHQLTASVTFDNTTKTTSKPYACDVTGLPYKAVPPKSESSDPIYGWTTDQGNAFNWTDTYLQLGVSSGQRVHTVYKQFYIPSSINCTLNAKIAAHNAPVNTTCSILLGDQTIMSVYSNGGGFNYNTTELEDSKAITMTNSDFKIVLKNSYSVTASWGRFYYVNINYR